MNRIPKNESDNMLIGVLVTHLPVMMKELLQSAFAGVSYISVIDRAEGRPGLDLEAGVSVNVILLGSSREDGDFNAVTVLRCLLERHKNAKAIVVTQEYAYEESISLFRAGAKGIFCAKSLRFDLLCKSIRCVHAGEIWADNDLVRHLIETLSHPKSRDVTDSQGRKLLTAREQQVLHLLADGLSNYQLAAELRLSQHTVKNHLFRIYEKLGVSNRMEAVLYALAPRSAQPKAIDEVQSTNVRLLKAG